MMPQNKQLSSRNKVVRQDMKRNSFCFKLVLVTVLLGAFVSTTTEAKKNSGISCKAAIFSDSTKVKRLYGKNVHERVLPASTTKVMTALLAMERLPLNKFITVGKNATSAQPSKLYLKPGEQYKVRDLLYAILLKSANDASIVLATAVSGSEGKFVSLMNQRAKQIGAVHTKFATQTVYLLESVNSIQRHMICI